MWPFGRRPRRADQLPTDKDGYAWYSQDQDARTLSPYERSTLKNIKNHGWMCVAVGEDASHLPFAYSVGFGASLAAPEFIVFGLERSLMHAMLWDVFLRIKETGNIPSGEERWIGMLEGFDCISRPVHPSRVTREYFNTALWHWGDPAKRGSTMPACQLFWPGAGQGLFPWEADCVDIVREMQPRLDLPDVVGEA